MNDWQGKLGNLEQMWPSTALFPTNLIWLDPRSIPGCQRGNPVTVWTMAWPKHHVNSSMVPCWGMRFNEYLC
jgi:hypothetical protein